MPPRTDWSNIEPIISRYEELPAVYQDYDPRAPHVAALIAQAVSERLLDVVVEHIGSTSVPGCAGKGVIDLMVVYPAGELEAAKSLLDALGFQPQTTRDPFPETRPMRIGALEYDGKTFRLHAHVIAADSPEVEELRLFRNRLRADPNLVAEYEARKREIIASGVTDSVDYSIEKEAFIQIALRRQK